MTPAAIGGVIDIKTSGGKKSTTIKVRRGDTVEKHK